MFWGASCGIFPHADIKHFVDLTSGASLPTQSLLDELEGTQGNEETSGGTN